MKINKKIILTLFITLLAVFCISGKVEASYSAASKTVKAGANVSITIKSSEKLESFDIECTDIGGLTYKSCSSSAVGAIVNSSGKKISYALPGGEATTLGTYNFTAPKVTEKTNYTVKFVVNDVTLTSTITVEPEKTNNGASNNNAGGNTTGTTNNNTGTTNNNSGTTQPEQPKTKSTNAYLSTLGVTPKEYDFSGFKKSNLNYSVTVPYEVDSLKVSYKAAHSGATVKVTGNSGFEVGSNNKIKIKVTAEDGKTTKTYTIKVTKLAEVEEKPGNIIDEEIEELYLTSLSLKGIELSPEFSKDTYAYTAKVSNTDKTEVEVNAVANKENAKIEISGNTNLVVGENTINIVVKQEESTMQTVYQITLTKEAIVVTTTGEEVNFMSSLIDNIKNYVIIAVIVVVLIIAAIVILIILLRKENKKLKNEETEEYNVYENNENEFEDNEKQDETYEQPIEEVTNETETKNERRTRRKEKGRHSK